jgi:membrane protease YdiL (CAAX protease family)
MDNDSLELHLSTSVRYGLFVTLPLFLHYVITETTSILEGNQMEMILNAELVLKKFAMLFGLLPQGFAAIFVIALLLFLCFRESARMGPLDLCPGDVLITIKQALPFAGILWVVAFIISLMQSGLPQGDQSTFSLLPMLFAMRSGAGFFEELLCRVLLLGGSLWILEKAKVDHSKSCVIAVIFSSLAFAEMHYFHFFPGLGQWFGIIDNPDNPYTIGGFAFRFMAGAFLGWVYLKKGFGVSAWSHALYGYFQVIQFFM